MQHLQVRGITSKLRVQKPCISTQYKNFHLSRSSKASVRASAGKSTNLNFKQEIFGSIYAKPQIQKGISPKLEDSRTFVPISGLEKLSPEDAANQLLDYVENARIPSPFVFSNTIMRLTEDKQKTMRFWKKAHELYEIMKQHGMNIDASVFNRLFQAAFFTNNEKLYFELVNDMKKQAVDPSELLQFSSQKSSQKPSKTSNEMLFSSNLASSKRLVETPEPEIQYFDQSLQPSTLSAEIDPEPFFNFFTELRKDKSSKGIEEIFGDIGEEEKELEKRQEHNEIRQVEEAQKKYDELIKMVKKLGRGACLAPAEKILVSWYEPLVEAIRFEQDQIKNGKSTIPAADRYGDYLLMLPAEQLGVLTMHTVLSLLMLSSIKKSGANRSLNFTKAVTSVAESVQAETNISRLKIEESGLFKYTMRNQPTIIKINRMSKWNLDDGKWTDRVRIFVGSSLVSMLLQTAKIDDQMAFQHDVSAQEGSAKLPSARLQGTVVPHEKLLRILGDTDAKKGEAIPIRSVVNAKFLPMICKPKPWRDVDDGGYLYYSNYVMRTKGVRLHKEVLESTGGKLEKVYQGLNALSSTPWKLNKKIYEVMSQAWEKGGGIAELPPRKDYDIPPEPETDDLQKKLEWKRMLRKITHHNRDLKSLRCDFTYKLNVAKEFLHEKKLFFPHSMDFRGRTYPIPPHLNHIGADISRSLLQFYEGKQLGERGLDWLKIHLANVYGHDKISFENRKKFVENHIDEILDSAARPLDGKRWWLNAEAPWQCLAACFELSEALKLSNPEEYIAHLPIHQDGTCNGLQHYAALGKDVFGGQEVNLLPASHPQDVYSTVAALVRKRVDEDAKDGHPQAILLQGKIERKIVKQTVMTSVYGVTFIGARQQISNAMQDRSTVKDEDLWKSSSYIAKLTFSALREMFVCARAIMDWLGVCAKEIAKKGHPVKWETPLNLPVVQPYRKEKGTRDHIKTLVQSICLKPDDHLPINVNKQKSAFPPNYIHSLDSSHMLLTAIGMKELNLTFASVHDSYWTHASTVDAMNHVLRQKFIEMHNEPVLERLLDYFEKNYPDCSFPPVPPRGELDLTKVMESPYFFN